MTAINPHSNAAVQWLDAELERRRHRNPRYSLRAYARDLDISAGALSHILQGKRAVSLKLVETIIDHFHLEPRVATRLRLSVAEAQIKRKLKRVDRRVTELLKDGGRVTSFSAPRVIDSSIFTLISRWYCAAILEMTFLKDFKLDPQWIAAQLGISTNEARLSLSQLMDLKLVQQTDDGRIEKVNDHLELQDPFRTSQARKLKQIEVREKAIHSIRHDPIEDRHMTSMTMCIDPKLLPKARLKIEKFNDELAKFLESKKRNRVYILEMGLFPVQKKSQRNHKL
jgi:uncharacterized protein (TIGR02147 family)